MYDRATASGDESGATRHVGTAQPPRSHVYSVHRPGHLVSRSSAIRLGSSDPWIRDRLLRATARSRRAPPMQHTQHVMAGEVRTCSCAWSFGSKWDETLPHDHFGLDYLHR
jgi:hypothetical protein